MVVAIDVDKQAHVAALLDERGGEIGTLGFANSPAGMQKLCSWLAERNAADAVVGVEGPAGSGRLLVASLEAAGHEVLNVPAWRTHRERRRQGPGKTDPGEAIAVAQVVLRKRAELGPALAPELVRALALLEPQRRRLLRDRRQAIQRLRADWNQIDPVSEAGVVNLRRQRELRHLKRISFGEGLVEQVATRCLRDLARDIEDLNRRIADLDREISELLAQHGNPLDDPHGAGIQITAAIIAHAGDVRRFRDAAAFARFCGAAPIPCGSGQSAGRHRRHRGGNRQLNAALYPIAIVQARHPPPARTYPTRKIAEAKTPRQARRALKRHLANVIYRRL
jgi:transposase